MNSAPFTDSAPTDGDCIVWTEEKPAVFWTSSSCEKGMLELDDKTVTHGCYSSLVRSMEEDLPPKYNSRDTSHRSILRSLLHLMQYIFLDHLLLKVVAAYLFLIYCTGASSLLSPLASSDWSFTEDLMRSHSRDFLGVNIYELYEDNDAWSRSRLGRVGPDSPLLTYSEVALVAEVVWEVEPDTDLESDEMSILIVEEHAPSPSKAQNKLPLPFRKPSSGFEHSRQLYHQEAKHDATQQPISKSTKPAIARHAQ